jgi:hypothetical protein
MVEVENSIELVWKSRIKVMADPLGLRAVDHAYGALEQVLGQILRRDFAFTHWQ